MNLSSVHALIIDDDPSWQSILSEILGDYGLEVDTTDHVQGAIEKLRSRPYRLVVVDLSLNETDHRNQDGLLILEAAKRLVPGCVTILLTGHASVELAVKAIQTYGAYTCLRKEAFRRVEFRQLVHEALASSMPAQAEEPPEREKKDSALEVKKEEPVRRVTSGHCLLVEDDAGWRSLLSELLSEAGYIVFTSSSYGEALGLMKRDFYQLAVIDISLASSISPEHNRDGFQLLTSMQQANIPAIVVSGSADTELIDQAYQENKVFAFLEKQSFERKTLLETITQIQSQSFDHHSLTEREIEVLSLVARGMSNKEISVELYITVNTVKRHLKSIFEKLEVNSRTAASAFAIRMGLGGQVEEQ